MPTVPTTATRVRPRALARAALVVGGLAAVLIACASDTELAFDGPADGEVLNAERIGEAAIVVRVVDDETTARFDEATVEHDGEDVTDAAVIADDELRFPLRDLEEGEHEIAVAVPRAGSETFAFAVHNFV